MNNSDSQNTKPTIPPGGGSSGKPLVMGFAVGIIGGAAIGWLFDQFMLGAAVGLLFGVLAGWAVSWWNGRKKDETATK